MGRGALSSKSSKLVEFCHCEDERSEDVALYQYPASYGSQVRLRCKPIAKSLHIDEITMQSTIARNDNNCHLERSERSQTHPNLVLDLLCAHRVSHMLLRNSVLNLFAIRTRFAPSVRKSAPLEREGTICHPELADCELRAELDGEMAKPLQTSNVDPLNASNQAVSASLNDTVFSRFTSHVSRNVLITYRNKLSILVP